MTRCARATHGVPRTNEDERRAVMKMLQDAKWSTWVDREIARQCKVSNHFVSKIRDGMSFDTGNIPSMAAETNERIFTHPKTGKPTTMNNTAAIGKRTTSLPARSSAAAD